MWRLAILFWTKVKQCMICIIKITLNLDLRENSHIFHHLHEAKNSSKTKSH